jgi:hypothetical protein
MSYVGAAIVFYAPFWAFLAKFVTAFVLTLLFLCSCGPRSVGGAVSFEAGTIAVTIVPLLAHLGDQYEGCRDLVSNGFV